MRKRPGAPRSGYSACSPQGERPNHGPEFSVSTFWPSPAGCVLYVCWYQRPVWFFDLCAAGHVTDAARAHPHAQGDTERQLERALTGARV